MTKHNYTVEDLSRDMEILVMRGLIEIKGVNENGELLYGVTERSLQMTEEERIALIMADDHPADHPGNL